MEGGGATGAAAVRRSSAVESRCLMPVGRGGQRRSFEFILRRAAPKDLANLSPDPSAAKFLHVAPLSLCRPAGAALAKAAEGGTDALGRWTLVDVHGAGH